MHKTRQLLAAASCAALLALASCNRQPEIINAGPADAQEEALKNAAPVALPPSIAATRTYRCKDNSLIQVDFMDDQKTAVLRVPKDASPIVLNAPEAGKPFTAPGYSVTGSGTQITVASPNKGGQDCKA